MQWVENPGWHDELTPDIRDWFSRLAGEIRDDAKTIAPVETGRLCHAVDSEVNGDTARIGSNVDYAGYVEEGHRIAYRGADGQTHYTGGVVPPQPYLRPALYRER